MGGEVYGVSGKTSVRTVNKLATPSGQAELTIETGQGVITTVEVMYTYYDMMFNEGRNTTYDDIKQGSVWLNSFDLTNPETAGSFAANFFMFGGGNWLRGLTIKPKLPPKGGVLKYEPPVTNEIYKRPNNATTPTQRASVQNQPCVDCGATGQKNVADHKTPLVKEHYETGTIDLERMKSVDAVQPQCPSCSAKQGASMSSYSKAMKSVIEKRTNSGGEQ